MQAVLDQAELVFDADAVDRAIDRLSIRITLALADRNPVGVCVMTGGVVLAGDLLRRLHFPMQLDYVHATRYRSGTRGGSLEWRALPATDLRGRPVLVIDDILDHGHTLAAVVDKLRALGAADVTTAVLIDKDIGESKPIAADFVALTGPNRYLFGRGMDFRGYWRNLAAIYAVPPHLLTD